MGHKTEPEPEDMKVGKGLVRWEEVRAEVTAFRMQCIMCVMLYLWITYIQYTHKYTCFIYVCIYA